MQQRHGQILPRGKFSAAFDAFPIRALQSQCFSLRVTLYVPTRRNGTADGEAQKRDGELLENRKIALPRLSTKVL